MKYLSILFLILLSLSLVSCTTTQPSTTPKTMLPDNFIITFTTNGCSSGGSCTDSSQSLIFKNDVVVEGNFSNNHGNGWNTNHGNCILDINKNSWICSNTHWNISYGEELKGDSLTTTEISVNDYPLTKEEMQSYLDKTFPGTTCIGRISVCYTITPF
jgi:hypothetical protein